MSGMDRLVAEIFRKDIENNLGKKTIRQIEKRLFEKYGITLAESMNDYAKFDVILQEFFGNGSRGMIRSILSNLCKLQKNNNRRDATITLYNPSLTEKILELLGDSDYRKILDMLIDKSMTTYEILDKTDIPQASAYRKIDALVDAGLLIEDQKILRNIGRPAIKLATLYRGLDMNIVKNRITVQVKISRNMLQKSSVFCTLYSL